MALQPVPSLPNANRIVTADLVASVGPIPLGANFPIYGSGEVEVYKDGQLVPSGYSLTSASGAPLPWTDAQVIFAAPQSGRVVVAGSRTPYTQDIFTDGGTTARQRNLAYNRVHASLREVWERLKTALRVPPGETLNTLPRATDRANTLLGFDSNGQPVATAVIQDPTLIASQPEAEAGVDNTKVMTALRTAQFANARILNSIASLRAINFATLPREVAVLGHTALGDGGEGRFYWDAASSATDDNGVTIKPTHIVGAGRWRRIREKGIVFVDWFGPPKGGVTDTLSVLQVARDLLAAEGGGILQFGSGQYRISDSFFYEAVGNVPITIRGVSETGTEILMANTGFAIKYYGTTGGGNEARGGGVENLKISKTGGGTCSGIDIANVYRGVFKNNETTGCGNIGIRITGRGAGDTDATAGTLITQNRCRGGIVGIQIKGDTAGAIVAAEVEISRNNCDDNATAGIWIANADKVVIDYNTVVACGDGNNGVLNKRGCLFIEYFGTHVKNVVCRYNEFGNGQIGAIQNVIIDAMVGGLFQHNRHIRNLAEYGTGAYLLGFSQTSKEVSSVRFEHDYFIVDGAGSYYGWNQAGTTMTYAQLEIGMPQFASVGGGWAIFNVGLAGVLNYWSNNGLITGAAITTTAGGISVTHNSSSTFNRTGADGGVLAFQKIGVSVGSVTVTGSATAYNTSSDEANKHFTGDLDPKRAIEIIKADPAREWNWSEAKGGGRGIGWGAQTSYRVSPDLATPGGWFDSETGARIEQDAPDAIYVEWGMDRSSRTPYLWAAVTWLINEIDRLKQEQSGAPHS